VRADPLPLAPVLRAWLRPEHLTLLALSVIGITGSLLSGSTAATTATDGPGRLAALTMLGGSVAIMGLLVGSLWREQLCRPSGRLTPRYRRVTGSIFTVLHAVQTVGLAATAWAHGLDDVLTAATFIAAAAIGPFALFILKELVVLGFAIALVVAVGAHVAPLLLVENAAIPAAAVATLGLMLGGLGLRRLLRSDEDDPMYHLGCDFTQAQRAAYRPGALALLIARLERAPAVPVRGDPLPPHLWAWAAHRCRLYIQVPWLLALFGNALLAGVAMVPALVGEPHVGVKLTQPLLFFSLLFPLSLRALPAWRACRPVEALRPHQRRREEAVNILALCVAQMRSVGLFALPVGLLLAAIDAPALADAGASIVIAATAAPALAVLELWASRLGVPARIVVYAAVMLGMVGAAQAMQVHGWTAWHVCACFIAADAALLALLFPRLVRSDID